MKKFFSMMVAVAAMFTFAACGDDAEGTDTKKPNGTKEQLAKPVVTVTETGDDYFTISWEAVANATEYSIFLDKNNKPTTTETTYTFTDLNAGTYKPRVMALGGENYKDSEYSDVVEIKITGASSVNWFKQTASLPEDSAELAAKGINSSNTVLFSWQGDGVQSLKYWYFENNEKFAKMTDSQIIDALEALDAETLAYVNTPEGVEFQWDDMAGNTEYVLCAYVVKNDKTFLDKQVIKTNPTQVTLGTQAWLGQWNASTPQIVDVQTNTFRDERTDFTLNITLYDDEYYSNFVWVDGFSVLGENAPAFGVVYHEKVLNADKTGYDYTGNYTLELMCYETIGELGEGSGVYAVWMPLCSKGNSGYTFVMGSFPGYTLTLNPTTGAVTCKPYSGTLSDDSPFEVKMMDVFGLDSKTSELYLMMMDEENAYTEYKAGGIQNATKAAAAASTASVAPKAMKVSSVPASVVVAM